MNERQKILFGTKEWAPYNFNFMNGCSNDCSYCYAKEMAIRFKRKNSENWKFEEPVSLEGKSFNKRNGRIMIPSSHDITPNNIEIAVSVIKKLLESGNKLLIVTKPHYTCISRLVNEFMSYRKEIQFRFTIGSVNTDILTLWEPGATGFEERLESLKHAFINKFSTSISVEPLLDDNIDNLVTELQPYVTDSIWIGKMNFPGRRIKMNNSSTVIPKYVEKLIASQSDEKIIKMWREYKNNPMIEWKESIKKVIEKFSSE
jgi:DNA repair photolyase